MMKRLKYLALAALFAFAACDEEGGTPVDTVQTGGVTGSVTAGGAGVSGVTVTLAGAASQSATTGANGAFTFSNVPVGNYVVTITGVPSDFVCQNTAQPVTVTANQTSTASFTCNVVQTASISGVVSAGPNPLAGASVRATGPNNYNATFTTVADGRFQFTGLRAGTYNLTLTPPAGVTCTTTTATVVLTTGQQAIQNFVCAGGGQAPEVTIESITMVTGAGTSVPADPDSLAGRVEVTVEIDRNGANLTGYQLLAVRGGQVIEICRQTFGQGTVAGPEGAPAAQDDLDITCSWNTDRTRDRSGATTIRASTTLGGDFAPIATDANRPFHPIFLNGDWQLVARVTAQGVDPVTATVDVTTRNTDAVILGVIPDNSGSATAAVWNDPTTGQAFPNALIDGGTGLRWLSGDMIITVFPIIFSAPFDPNNPLLTRAAFAFNGFVGGANVRVGGSIGGGAFVGDVGPITTPNANGTFTFNFCEAVAGTSSAGATCYSRIAAFNTGDIGARAVALQTITTFGQFGPTLANLKSVQLFDQDLASGTRGLINDVLRIDNEGPTAGSLLATLLPHPANLLTGVAGFSRTGLGGLSNFGWVAHADNLNSLVVDPANDTPNVYPAGGPGLDQIFGTADDGPWCDLAGDLCRAPGAFIRGIGIPSAPIPELLFVRGPGYQDPSDFAVVAPSTTAIISGALRTGESRVSALTLTGAQLPPETGLGLDALPAPNSDTELDYGLAGQHWDRFGNTTNTAILGAAGRDFLLLGVDGKAPIFSNAAGTTQTNPTDPTAVGSIWDPYDNRQHYINIESAMSFGQALFLGKKTPGVLRGWTTDRDNGFSGVAGVVAEDWEWACPAGTVDGCTGPVKMNSPASTTSGSSRFGYTLQPVAPGGATTVLAFSFAATAATGLAPAPSAQPAAANTFMTGAVPVSFAAYLASNLVAGAGDGYRDQNVRSYDRAGNVNLFEAINEGIADHFPPLVGNVQMPTVVTFSTGSSYTFGGEAQDNVDLRKTDFNFDFNSILSIQAYTDPAGGSGNPATDVSGQPYQATSLQLPLPIDGATQITHTAFGSASIALHSTFSGQAPFLACLVRFDEAGVATNPSGTGTFMAAGPPEPFVHRPRGPRWRTWDHANPVGRHVLGGTVSTSAIDYGLVNTQFNTFVPSSLPGCTAVTYPGVPPLPSGSGGAYGAGIIPALGSTNPDGTAGWQFLLVSGVPTLRLTGVTATFVPNIDFSKVRMYYLDVSGRAILLDTGTASNWTVSVADVGTGGGGRQWTFTYAGTLPAAAEIVQPVPPNPQNGTVGGYFFTYEVRPGEAIIWDRTSNPTGCGAGGGPAC